MNPPLDTTLVEHSDLRSTSTLIRLARVFDERVMGLLALIALGTTLGPMVFDVGPGVERALTVVEWVLVGMFAAEFLLQGAIAPDRRAWMRSPWRIVDAVTVLGPIAALLPQVSDVASGSLMLRMLRLGRAVAFGTRAGSVAVRRPRRALQTLHGARPMVTTIGSNGDLRPAGSDWDRFVAWARQPDDSWFHRVQSRWPPSPGTSGGDTVTLTRGRARPARNPTRQGDRCGCFRDVDCPDAGDIAGPVS